MSVFLGRARPKGSAWLCFHILLLMPFATTKGELCRSWAYRLGNPTVGAFFCPERSDGADAKFCCGTCSAPYCCSSGEARLDPTRCLAAQQANGKTDTPQPGVPTPAPPSRLPQWAQFLITIAAILLFMCLSYPLSYCVRYGRRRFVRWWEARHLNENIVQFPLPTLRLPSVFDGCLPSVFDRPPSYCGDPPPYSIEDPQGPGVSSPISNVPCLVQPGRSNAGYQMDEPQPGPSRTPEGLAASQVHASSSSPSSSDAGESQGPSTPPSASEELGTPRHNNASALDYNDDPPPYSVEDPNDSGALSAVQGNPEVQLVDRSDSPPRHSDTDSPTPAAQDPPSYSAVVQDPPSYSAAIQDPPPYSAEDTRGPVILPPALDSSPVAQSQSATPGTAEAERIVVSPPALLDATGPTSGSASA